MKRNDWEVSLKLDGVPIFKKKHATTKELEDIFAIAKKKENG